MANSNFTEFNLPKNAYTAFDAVSMKELIKNRLKDSNLFNDIDFEGSNISGLVDIIAYTYHVLLFYLNQTASEALFSQADLLENMNKIVALLDYKPRGASTAQLKVDVYASNTLDIDIYNIKRFSSIFINNIRYTFTKDITFQKVTSSDNEYIQSIGDGNLLYQGKIREYPLYAAIGENYEEVVLNISYPETESNKFIDNNNIFVFIKPINASKWIEAVEVENLFLSQDKVYAYEKRLNEFGHFQFKFGDGINGNKLNAGDAVAIYYLESDGNLGIVGSNSPNVGTLTPLFISTQFDQIMLDISDKEYIKITDLSKLKFVNPYASIPPKDGETVKEIRENVPSFFSAQNRLVTSNDYKSFIKRNFSDFIHDVSILSNDEYTANYLKYFYTVGLQRPNLNENVLLNQIQYRNACDFNNVYVFCVPKTAESFSGNIPRTLFDVQKQIVVDYTNNVKVINQNVVMADPIFIAFDFGIVPVGTTPEVAIINDTRINIIRQSSTLISKEKIRDDVFAIIKKFFSVTNNKLGQLLDLNQLSLDILSLNGVSYVETESIMNGVSTKTNKLSLIYWNPIYPNINVNQTIQNVKMENFEFPFLYDEANLLNKIVVM